MLIPSPTGFDIAFTNVEASLKQHRESEATSTL